MKSPLLPNDCPACAGVAKNRAALCIRTALVFAALCCLQPTDAAPAKSKKTSASVIEKGGTLYLNDPALLAEKPMLLPKPNPTPTPTPRPSPRANTRKQNSVSAGREPTNHPHIPAGSLRGTFGPPSPPLQTLRPRPGSQTGSVPNGLTVGTSVPYPTQYAAPQVSVSGTGTAVVVPATPTRFSSTELGTSFDGNSFVNREFQGFINYGSPIRTLAPVFDREGRQVGFQVIETPNPVLQPIFRTIEIRR